MAFGLGRLLGRGGPILPVVRIAGVIGSAGAFRQGVTVETIQKPLEAAFAVKSAPAVAVVVNSPGGAPVQSHLIYQRIRGLAAAKRKPVLVFVEDVAASGGYLIALAGDEIIADPSSIVGSIGVVTAGFGFTGLIEKLGVERRVYTAGSQKVMLDPFQPEKADDVAHLKALQREVHETFTGLVRARRPQLADATDLFTGAFWTGTTAAGLGLVDRLGDLRSVATERFGEKVTLRPFGQRRSFLQRRLGMGGTPGLAAASVDAMMASLEERAQWSRFGL